MPYPAAFEPDEKGKGINKQTLKKMSCSILDQGWKIISQQLYKSYIKPVSQSILSRLRTFKNLEVIILLCTMLQCIKVIKTVLKFIFFINIL